MPKTQKQIRAARQNAQKSTGPKTESGKAASSQNAVKHGLYAKSIIIDSPQLKEDPEEYAALLASLQQELQPEGVMQNQLVRTIADCFWRKQRFITAETAYIKDQIDDIKPEEVKAHLLFMGNYHQRDEESRKELQTEVDRRVALQIGKYSIPCEGYAQRLLRYERHLDRQLSRTYKLLRDLKADRKQRTTLIPPPIPDDAINDRGPFTGLADIEADPAVSYPGVAMLAPCSGLTPSRRDTPRRVRPGGFGDGLALQPKNDETNLSHRIQNGHMLVQGVSAKPPALCRVNLQTCPDLGGIRPETYPSSLKTRRAQRHTTREKPKNDQTNLRRRIQNGHMIVQRIWEEVISLTDRVAHQMSFRACREI